MCGQSWEIFKIVGSKCKISGGQSENKNVKVGLILNFKKNYGCFVILKFEKDPRSECEMWTTNFFPPFYFSFFLFLSFLPSPTITLSQISPHRNSMFLSPFCPTRRLTEFRGAMNPKVASELTNELMLKIIFFEERNIVSIYVNFQ